MTEQEVDALMDKVDALPKAFRDEADELLALIIESNKTLARHLLDLASIFDQANG